MVTSGRMQLIDPPFRFRPPHLPAKACCARGLSRSAPGFTYLPYISPCFIIFLSACAWIFCLCYISYDQIQEPSLYVSLYVA